MRYRRADHVAWRQIDDEMVLVDLVAKEMLGLNAAGGEVWEHFGIPRDAEQMAQALTASNDALSAAEVEGFVSQLVSLGLLVASAGPSEAGSLPVVSALPCSPQVLWREEVRQAAGTCAFLPGSSPLCNQAPFS